MIVQVKTFYVQQIKQLCIYIYENHSMRASSLVPPPSMGWPIRVSIFFDAWFFRSPSPIFSRLSCSLSLLNPMRTHHRSDFLPACLHVPTQVYIYTLEIFQAIDENYSAYRKNVFMHDEVMGLM